MADSVEVANLITRLKADITDFESGMKKAQGAVKEAETQTKSSAEGMSSAFKAVAGAVTAAGIVEGIRSIIDVTNEEDTAHARLVATIENVTGANEAATKSTEDWITKQAEATGFTKGEMTSAMNVAVLATHNLAASQTIVSQAEDVARAKGIDLTTATNLLSKAHEGNTTMLVKQFPELQALKAANASGAEMVDYLANSVRGQAGAFADTAQGSMARFNVGVQELETSIGNMLLPVLADVATTGAGVIDFFNKHQQVAVALAGVIGGPLVAALTIYTVKKTIAFAEDVIGVISKTAQAITGFLIPSIEGATAAEEGFGAMEAIVTGGLSLLAGGAALVAFHVLSAKAATTEATGAMQDATGATEDYTTATKDAASAADTAHSAFMGVVNAQQAYNDSLRSIKSAQSDLTDAQAKLNTLLETHGVDVQKVTEATKAYDNAVTAQTKAQQDLDGAVRKLNDDLKPATLDEMTTAQDKLRSSTLDLQDAQKGLADAIKKRDDIAKALADGTSLDPASADDLTIAQGAATDAFTKWQATLSDGKSTVVDVAKAHKDYTDALQALSDLQKQGKVTADDLAAANEDVTRKTIAVDGATVGLHGSQANLNTVMQQGTALDPTIIADRQTIADRTTALGTATGNVATAQTALNVAEAGDPNLKTDIAGLRKNVADKTEALATANQHAATQALSLSGQTSNLTTAIGNGTANRADMIAWIKDIETQAPGARNGLDGILGEILAINSQPALSIPNDPYEVKGINSSGGMADAPLPRRAGGGPVMAGMPYVVGENQPELFIPNQSGTIIPNVPSGGGGGGGGTTVIQLVMDGKVVTEVVHDGLLSKQRRTGNLGFVAA